MYFALLITGVTLWALAHWFKRIAPARRNAMGDAGKGAVALALLASLALMIIGYRGAERIDLWYPPVWMTHLNNLLMLISLYFFAVSGLQTRLHRVVRHPQLTAVKTWAFAHLLVNGDLASVILFGGLLAWAVVSVILINRANRDWTRPEPAPLGKEIGAVVSTLVLLAAIGWVHSWLGYWPFG